MQTLDQQLLYLVDNDPGSTKTMQALIDAKANVNALDESDYPLLQRAVLKNDLSLVEFFLSQPAIDVNAIRSTKNTIWTSSALSLAMHTGQECIELLVNHGANMFFRDTNEETVLHHLVWSERFQSGMMASHFRFLMDRGIGPCLFEHGKWGTPIETLRRDYLLMRPTLLQAMEETRQVYRKALGPVVPVVVLVNVIVHYIG